LSFTLTLDDALGERSFTAQEFPLSLGGTGSTIVLAGGFDGPRPGAACTRKRCSCSLRKAWS
jgi:hypothetical protein